MDERRFDALTRRLGEGASRRSFIKGLLGLSGAVAAGSHLDAEAARRPTPTPRPVVCPGNQTWNGSACICPTGNTNCGPDCCPVGQAECCDNACCYGTCYGEELCCPSAQEFCPISGECCPARWTCCPDSGCCDGTCVGGVCCEGDRLCNGGTVCCPGGTTCAPTDLFINGVRQELCCASGKACSDDDSGGAVCCDSPSSTCYRYGCCDSGEFCLAQPGNPICCPAGTTCAPTDLFINGVRQELCCASGKACSDDDSGGAVCCDSPSSTCYRYGCCDSGVICNGDPGNPVCCPAGQVCDQSNTACVNV